MLHNVHLLQRRFPKQATRIVTVLVLLSLAALALGIGLLVRG